MFFIFVGKWWPSLPRRDFSTVFGLHLGIETLSKPTECSAKLQREEVIPSPLVRFNSIK